MKCTPTKQHLLPEQVAVMRHGKDKGGILTEKAVEQLSSLAGELRNHVQAPNILVIHTITPRTLETARILGKRLTELSCNVSLREESSLARKIGSLQDLNMFLAEIHPDDNTFVLFVGHEPEIAFLLKIGESEEIPNSVVFAKNFTIDPSKQ